MNDKTQFENDEYISVTSSLTLGGHIILVKAQIETADYKSFTSGVGIGWSYNISHEKSWIYTRVY